MRFNLESFEVEIPDFGDKILINRLMLNQIKAIIRRHEAYLAFLKQLFFCLETVSYFHYKNCPFNVLSSLKECIQSFIWGREALAKVIDYLEKDIEFYRKQYETLKEIKYGK